MCTLVDEISVGIYSRIDNRLVPTGASRFYFINRIGDFKQPARTLEQMSLKIGTQSVTNHIASEIIHNTRKLVHLRGCEELRLVHKKPFHHRSDMLEIAPGKFIKVGIRIDPLAFPLDAYTRAYNILLVAGIDHRLHAQVTHPAFLEIISRCKKQCRLGRPHGAITEI